jgi:hypothetical protein
MVSAVDYRVVLSIDYYTRRLAIVRNRVQRYKKYLEWQKTRFFSHARVYSCHVHIMRIDPFSKKEIIYKNEKSTQRVLRLLW